MKKFVLFLVVLFSGYVPSQAQSMLNVSLSDDNTPINVAVDGRYFGRRGTSVTVGELPAGTHSLKIYTMRYTRRGRGYEDVVYSGMVNTDEGTATLFIYDPGADRVDIHTQDMNSYVAEHPRFVHPGNNRQFENAAANNAAAPAPAAPEPAGTLTDAKISDLKAQAATKKTDVEIMAVLKDGLKNEQVTARQVGDMMDWFSFESSKEDFAKWCYRIAVDKDNFVNLESKFTFKNYQDDLDNFLKNGGK